MENWKTKTIVMEGGTRLDIEPISRDQIAPGSLLDSQNFESGHEGGYRRITGFAKYDTTVVPGADRVLGCFVFNDGVLACRSSAIYFGTGTGWSADIAPSARTNASQYRAAKYRWTGGTYITLVDSVNTPVRFTGAVGVDLTNAPVGATCVKEHKNHLFFGKGATLTFSAPDDDTDYTSASGGGAIVIGDTITNLAAWRGSLFIFCTNSIHVLTGDDLSDFAVAPVTKDLGCNFPDTVIEVNGDIMFGAPDGIRLISRVISSGEVNVDTLSGPVQQFIQTNIALYKSDRVCAVACDDKTQYRLFFSASDETAAVSPGLYSCLAEGPQGNSWEFFKTLGIQAACADHGRISSGATELIVHAAYDGYVYQQEYGNSFNGSNISAFIQLPFWVFDDPAIRKILYKLRLYITVDDDALAEITAQVYLDDNDATVLQPDPIDLTTFIPADIAVYGFTGGLGGGSKYGMAVYGKGASSNYRTQLVGGGFNASLYLSSNDTNPAYSIKTAILEYALGARQ
jgi:hypothetical protein